MRHLVRVLAVAILVAMMLAASVSPALAKKILGGVLLQTSKPCEASLAARNVDGAHLILNPEGRAPGCWVQLPPSSIKND